MLDLKSFFRRRDRGSVLVATGLCIVGIIGSLGLVVDLGRAFIIRSELQVFTDSAALAANMELDGTNEGLDRARDQVSGNTNKWNFATAAVSSPTAYFATSSSGPWTANPTTPRGYLYTRVAAQASLGLYFLPVVAGAQPVTAPGLAFLMFSASPSIGVKADSAAGQLAITQFDDGLLPFSPFAHDATAAPHFGLVPGGMYTLRWASNPKLNKNTCSGDDTQEMIDLANAGGGSERGYIEDTSASVIRDAIENGTQTYVVQIGGTVNMTGGAKETERDALIVRINQDTDSTAENYAEYAARGRGNGRRLVAVPINTGHPNYAVVQFGAFLLQEAADYDNGGNNPWCAEYVGAYMKDSSKKGVSDSGAYVSKLVK